jgi:hypothetical protein
MSVVATLVARVPLLLPLRLLYKRVALWHSFDSCHVIFLKGFFSFVWWGFLLFGVVYDAVMIPWILVLIIFMGFPFGLDGLVLYTI